MSDLTSEERQKDDLDNFMFELESEDKQVLGVQVSKVDVDTSEVLAQLLAVTFALVATRAGEHWNLSAEESELAGKAYGDVIDKYYPDAGQYMGVEITAVMVTGALIMPRMIIGKQKKNEARASVENVVSEKSEVDQEENVNGGFGAVDTMRGVQNGD